MHVKQTNHILVYVLVLTAYVRHQCLMVERVRLELTTFCVQSRYSPN